MKHLAKQKYRYGNPGIATWVFGAVEYDTGYCWVEKVENRNKKLLTIISREILSKSYVITDRWSAYNSILDKYTDSVSHKYNFVDPESRYSDDIKLMDASEKNSTLQLCHIIKNLAGSSKCIYVIQKL
ncbi:hypothetical protein DMUE_0749 [Dictyocoela muelleri]|nr:hypothetical protein DMUE_0749 [Dictyocoela muelleri]